LVPNLHFPSFRTHVCPLKLDTQVEEHNYPCEGVHKVSMWEFLFRPSIFLSPLKFQFSPWYIHSGDISRLLELSRIHWDSWVISRMTCFIWQNMELSCHVLFCFKVSKTLNLLSKATFHLILDSQSNIFHCTFLLPHLYYHWMFSVVDGIDKFNVVCWCNMNDYVFVCLYWLNAMI